MFDDPQYTGSGALFFKDRNLGREKKQKWIRQILPKPISESMRKENRFWSGESAHMPDSGVVLATSGSISSLSCADCAAEWTRQGWK